jgi:hypothetical protein
MNFFTKFALAHSLFLIFLIAAQAENSSRMLLKPPKNIPTIHFNHTEFIQGEIYLSKTTNPDSLKHLGFRDLRFVAAASNYNRYSAYWPISMCLDSLPPAITGISYPIHPDPQKRSLLKGTFGLKISVTDSSITLRNIDGTPYKRFGYAMPVKSDTMILGLPYSQGMIYLTSLEDTTRLHLLGFTSLYLTLQGRYLHYDRAGNINSSLPDNLKWLDNPIYIYSTCWPMALNLEALPQSVITLINNNYIQTQE